MSTWGRGGVPRHVRVRIFERDGWHCQLGYDGCTYHAEEVDHIVGVAELGVDRGEANDDDNLRAVCASCHHIRTEAQRITAWRAAQQRRREHLHPMTPHPGEW